MPVVSPLPPTCRVAQDWLVLTLLTHKTTTVPSASMRPNICTENKDVSLGCMKGNNSIKWASGRF